MKVKHLFFSMIAAAFLSSAIPVQKNPGIGESAPRIETIEGINVGYDANSEGKEKLISFWTPKNAESRISNRNLSLKYGNNENDIEFVSICIDSDSELMDQVMKIDNVKADKSFAYSDLSPRVFKDFGVEKSPKAFLISKEGKIKEII